MDTMIFCHECKVQEMIDFAEAEDWRCPKCNQPERLNPETQLDKEKDDEMGKYYAQKIR